MKRGNILGVESGEGESDGLIDFLARLPRVPGRTETLPQNEKPGGFNFGGKTPRGCDIEFQRNPS